MRTVPTATYLDSSVLLAEVFLEPKRPASGFWRRHLLSSRLLEYEARTRLNAKALPPPVSKAALELIETVELHEMSPKVLARARDPWPVAIRTLDAPHLATFAYLRGTGADLDLATYDRHMADAAAALGLPLASLA
jgi:predicted nucleic acid-binding protein